MDNLTINTVGNGDVRAKNGFRGYKNDPVLTDFGPDLRAAERDEQLNVVGHAAGMKQDVLVAAIDAADVGGEPGSEVGGDEGQAVPGAEDDVEYVCDLG
jgi:hypothetical protein